MLKCPLVPPQRQQNNQTEGTRAHPPRSLAHVISHFLSSAVRPSTVQAATQRCDAAMPTLQLYQRSSCSGTSRQAEKRYAAERALQASCSRLPREPRSASRSCRRWPIPPATKNAAHHASHRHLPATPAETTMTRTTTEMMEVKEASVPSRRSIPTTREWRRTSAPIDRDLRANDCVRPLGSISPS